MISGEKNRLSFCSTWNRVHLNLVQISTTSKTDDKLFFMVYWSFLVLDATLFHAEQKYSCFFMSEIMN